MLASASELVGNAMGFLGVRYRYRGTTPETGFDCSGFVRATFEKTLGRILPRRAAEQAAATDHCRGTQAGRPGVFQRTMRRAFSHVGIYIGDGKFIHSPRTGSSVRVDNMHSDYWVNRFNGARRVIENNASAAGEWQAWRPLQEKAVSLHQSGSLLLEAAQEPLFWGYRRGNVLRHRKALRGV